MSIKMKLLKHKESPDTDEDIFFPVFVCDVCNQRITHMGAYVYKVLPPEYEPEGTVYFVHKGNCHRVIEASDSKVNFHWNDIDDFINFLRVNFETPAIEHKNKGITK